MNSSPDKSKSPSLRFVWVPRANQDALLRAFGVSDGPVDLVVVNARKLRYANFIGAFTEGNVGDFVSDVLSGMVRTSAVDSIPALEDVDAKVAAQVKEEIFDDADDYDEKDEL